MLQGTGPCAWLAGTLLQSYIPSPATTINLTLMRQKQNIFGNECFLLNCYHSLTSFFSRKNSKNVLQDSYSLVIQPNANLGTVVEGLYRWTAVANQKTWKETILVDSTELHKPWEQRTMEEELVRRKGRKKMRKKGKLKTLETMSHPLLLSLKMRESWM